MVGLLNGKGLSTTVMFQVVAWLCAAMLAYGMARADIAVLQSRQEDDRRRLERIEQKLDDIINRLPLFGH